jgi:hypothetical protein
MFNKVREISQDNKAVSLYIGMTYDETTVRSIKTTPVCIFILNCFDSAFKV